MEKAFETAMLLCFGFSWPISVVKNIKAQTAKSTSVSFILLILSGYVMGICAKLISGNSGYVLYVYILNFAIVFLNLLVYFRNRHIDEMSISKEEVITMPELKQNHSPEIVEQVNMFSKFNSIAPQRGEVFLGDDSFAELPIEEYFQTSGFSIPVFNRSIKNMTIDDACYYSDALLSGLDPQKIFLCFGAESREAGFDQSAFLKKYEWFLYSLNAKEKAQLIIVAMAGETDLELRRSIESLADEYGCEFISIDDNTERLNADSVLMRFRPYMRNEPITFAEAMNIIAV